MSKAARNPGPIANALTGIMGLNLVFGIIALHKKWMHDDLLALPRLFTRCRNCGMSFSREPDEE